MGGLDEVKLIWFPVAFKILFKLKFLVESGDSGRLRCLCAASGRQSGRRSGGHRSTVRRFDEI